MLRQKGLSKINRIGLIVLTIALIISPFLAYYNPFHQSKAVGGGFVGNQSVKTITTNASSTSQTPNVFSEIKGNFLVAAITTYDPSISVSSISDTQSDTYHHIITSTKYEDTEFWYANFTGTNFAANTV